MSSSTVWMVVALFCLAGIVLALLQINRIMDYSRTFFGRWNKTDRGDEGGIWTPLDRHEKAALDTERHRLGRSDIPESTLRADLPPGTCDEVEAEVASRSQDRRAIGQPVPGLKTESGVDLPRSEPRSDQSARI